MKTTSLLALGIVLFSFPIAAQINQSQLGRGDEWLSWHQEQRQGYVWGYSMAIWEAL
jgi:hypothetical protein